MINRDNKFCIDYESKIEFSGATVNYINSINSNWVVDFYGVDDDGNKVSFDDSTVTSHLDFYMDITTSSGITEYAVELKERWKPYTSTSYGEPGQEGWFLNIEKTGFLKDAAERGYIPLYANIYQEDGKVRVWNLNKIDVDNLPIAEKYIARYTVLPSERKLQKRYTLSNAQAVAEYNVVKRGNKGNEYSRENC